MVRHAFRVLTDDKIKTRLIAFSDDMDGLRKVPDNVPNKEMLAQHLGKPLTRVPDPFGTHPTLRRAQQCAAARLPRHVRLRLRVRQLDRLLHVRPLRRDAAADAGALRRGDGDHAAVAARGARARPIRRSCRSARAPAWCCRCRSIAHDAKAGTITYDDPETRRARRRRPVTGGHVQAAVEARLGDALGRARRRLRDGRQGPDRLREAVGQDLPRRSAARRRKASTTNCSSTTRARRFRSRRATA